MYGRKFTCLQGNLLATLKVKILYLFIKHLQNLKHVIFVVNIHLSPAELNSY